MSQTKYKSKIIVIWIGVLAKHVNVEPFYQLLLYIYRIECSQKKHGGASHSSNPSRTVVIIGPLYGLVTGTGTSSEARLARV